VSEPQELIAELLGGGLRSVDRYEDVAQDPRFAADIADLPPAGVEPASTG
jgi:hypothetical protein